MTNFAFFFLKRKKIGLFVLRFFVIEHLHQHFSLAAAYFYVWRKSGTNTVAP